MGAGLPGDEIPVFARIVAITDVFDAFSHDRPYRSAWAPQRVLEEIRRGRSRHFDPAFTDRFLDLSMGGGFTA